MTYNGYVAPRPTPEGKAMSPEEQRAHDDATVLNAMPGPERTHEHINALYDLPRDRLLATVERLALAGRIRVMPQNRYW